MEVCEICGREFRAINLNHLRTHGILRWEDYHERIARNTKPDQTLMQDVVHGLLHRQEIADEHQEALARTYEQRRRQMPGVVATFELRSALRLVRLYKLLDTAEEIAYDREKIAKLAFEDLMRLIEFASGDIRAILKDLSAEAKKNGVGGFATTVETMVNNTYNILHGASTTMYDEKLAGLDPRSRSALMTKVDEMTRRIERGEGPPPIVTGKVVSRETHHEHVEPAGV